MKIAVSATEGKMSSSVDPRFGRSKWFLVIESDTGEHSVIDNIDASESASGAGIATAQKIVGTGATHVLTGHVGPNAARVLEQGGVKVVDGVTGTVQEAADKARQDGL